MICGIDPGLTGGIAFLHNDVVLAIRTPVIKVQKKNYLNVGEIVSLLMKHDPDHIYIEKQQAMPKQGVASTFRTGFGYGVYLGLIIALGIKHTEVTARQWKKDLCVPADKNMARGIATKLYPHASSQWKLKCEDGVAESTLIAHWGAKFQTDQSVLQKGLQ